MKVRTKTSSRISTRDLLPYFYTLVLKYCNVCQHCYTRTKPPHLHVDLKHGLEHSVVGGSVAADILSNRPAGGGGGRGYSVHCEIPLSINLSIPSIHPSKPSIQTIHPFIHPSIHPSIRPSIYPSVHIDTKISVARPKMAHLLPHVHHQHLGQRQAVQYRLPLKRSADESFTKE